MSAAAVAGGTRERRWLVAVLAVALLARGLAWAPYRDAHAVYDEAYYVNVGLSISNGEGHDRGYGDDATLAALRPPLFPALLALVFSVARTYGDTLSFAFLRACQIPLSLLTVFFVFSLCARRFGTRAAVLSGLLCALSPALVHYSHFLWAESLAATLLAALFWCLDRFDREERPRDLALAGLALGLLALTKQAWLYFAAPIVVWLLLRAAPPRRRAAAGAALLLAVLALCVAPWTLRNWSQLGRPVLISTMRWWPIAIGNLENPTLEEKRALMHRAGELPEDEREPFYREVALASIAAQQPGWLPRKLVAALAGLYNLRSQPLRFLDEGWIEPSPGVARLLIGYDVLGFYATLVPGVLGLWLVPGGRPRLLVAGALLYLTGLHTLANAIPRYHVSVVPLLLLYGGPFLAGAARGARPWQWAGALATVALLVGLPLPRSARFLGELLARVGAGG